MKTVIEAGHYYETMGPSELSVKGWEIGKEMADNEPGSKLVLFVDDYHPTQDFVEPGDSFLSPDQAALRIATMMAEADHVFREAKLATNAQRAITALLDDKLVKLRSSEINAKGIKLGEVVNGDIASFVPNCVFLDFLLLAQKVLLGGEQIVVLPKTYKTQQAKLLKVIRNIRIDGLVSYTTVYHGVEANDNVVSEVSL